MTSIGTDALMAAANDRRLLDALASHRPDEAVDRLAEICLESAALPGTDRPDEVRAMSRSTVKRRRVALREVASLFVREWLDLDHMTDGLLVATAPETRAMLRHVMSETGYREWLGSALVELLTPY